MTCSYTTLFMFHNFLKYFIFRCGYNSQIFGTFHTFFNMNALLQVCDKYWAGGVLEGFDKENGPIWILPIGRFDPKGKPNKNNTFYLLEGRLGASGLSCT